jgi:hypothetical protein
MAELAAAASAFRASADYAGSGGSIICVCQDGAHQSEVIDCLRAAGCGAIAPSVGRPAVSRVG